MPRGDKAQEVRELAPIFGRYSFDQMFVNKDTTWITIPIGTIEENKQRANN